MKYIPAIMAVAAGVLLSCSGGEKPEGKVLARVNDEVLTTEKLMYQIPADYRNQLDEASLNEMVENWINTEVLYQEAVRRGLDDDPEVKAIIEAGIKDAVARKLVDKELENKVVIPPSRVDSVYAAQKDSFRLEEDRFRASHIFLDNAGDAEAIYSRLQKGDDFSALARDYSMDRQSAERGGDIGYFGPNDIDPAFVAAASELSVGDYSKPIKTAYGYHIIKLTDRQKAGEDLDSLQAKSSILQTLYTQQHAKAFNDLLERLKASADIEKNPAGNEEGSVPGE
jgi:parvulin-like peptidyl-prolyl isomerase